MATEMVYVGGYDFGSGFNNGCSYGYGYGDGSSDGCGYGYGDGDISGDGDGYGVNFHVHGHLGADYGD